MSYIDKTYYDSSFCGNPIPVDEFNRLADIASEIVFAVCRVKPDEDDVKEESFKKAVAYQVEYLQEQGGVDAILGFSDAQLAAGGESLGDYSVSAGGRTSSQPGSSSVSIDGIPVSSMAILLLRRMGLMSRCAYAGVYRAQQKHSS